MVSLLTVMKDGRSADTMTVGREGALGTMAGVGPNKSQVRCVVRLLMASIKISAAQFRRAAADSEAMRMMCINCNEEPLSQTRMSAACYALAPTDARLSACPLRATDHLGSDTIPLTQDVLAEMLVVRHASVTEAASKLQLTGVITYSRGKIGLVLY
jgi:CRP-like cAMP-binding protein